MIEGIIKTKLKIYEDDKGSVMHGIKKDDNSFAGFGETYFSTVNKDIIKAWKMHKKMTLNLVVPTGSVLFCFIDTREDSATCNETNKFIISQDSYFRLTVPPKIWFGFKGISDKVNLICNIADIAHDPNEIMRKELNEFKIDWRVE